MNIITTTNIIPLARENESLRAQNSLLRQALESLVARANTPAFLATCYNPKRGARNRSALDQAYSVLQLTSEQ